MVLKSVSVVNPAQRRVKFVVWILKKNETGRRAATGLVVGTRLLSLRGFPCIDDRSVTGRPRGSGLVVKALMRDNQQVKAVGLLVALDPQDFKT